MNKPSKCKNCPWYGKPYWSIINPCDNCPNENDYKTIITIDGEPLFKEYLTDEDIKKAMYEKIDFIVELKEKDKEIERLNKTNIIMEKYLELIYDLGYDYDGLDEKESLKKLIDELVRYASLGRVCNTTEPIYINKDEKYNILHEKLKEDNSGN